jgi:hypothetical protein
MAGQLMNAVQYSAYGGGPDGLQVTILFYFPCFLLYIYFVFHTLLPEVLETVVFFLQFAGD